MASDIEYTSVTEFTAENAEQTGLTGVEKKERSGNSAITDKEAKAYRKDKSYETSTRAGKSLS